jgi:hypothetical protein
MPDSATSLRALLERIEQLGGADLAPVVSLDAFFEGNDDEASIGPNLDPHPGIDTFSRVLREIDDRDSVAHVVVQISEVMSEDEWPFSDRVYVITTSAARDVHDWAEELDPDPYDDAAPEGWVGGTTPPGASAVPDGHRVVCLFWD